MLRRFGTVCLLLSLIAASAPEGWIRKGNRAFADGDHAAALNFFERAEITTDDPGLVAFNKAAVYYHLGNFSEAARCYRQSLEDAEAGRRARALYGLANSLVEQGRSRKGKRAVQLLKTACDRYRECMTMESELVDEQTVFADARFNLQIAERLLDQKQKEPDEPIPEQDPAIPPDRPKPPMVPEPGELDPSLDPASTGDDGSGLPRDTEQTRPGQGNLPPLLDDKNALPLSADAASQHLLQAMKRIRNERANRPATGAADPATVRDW